MCERMKLEMIYMDHAATTRMTPAVIQAMCLCMENTWYNPSSLYVPAQKAAEALWSARACIELTFTRGAVRQITRQFFPLPKQAHRLENGISSPQPLNTMPSFIP